MSDMNDPHLEQFLDLCRRVYERQLREGTALWPDDSPTSENMIESEDNPNNHEK